MAFCAAEITPLGGSATIVFGYWHAATEGTILESVSCPFEEVGRGLTGNLTLPSGMVLPVVAVHSPTGASWRGFASSTEQVAVNWCFGCGLPWLVLGLRLVPSHGW